MPNGRAARTRASTPPGESGKGGWCRLTRWTGGESEGPYNWIIVMQAETKYKPVRVFQGRDAGAWHRQDL